MKKISLVGLYPPPIGGISIHIKRLKEYLESIGYEVNLYNESKEESEGENIHNIKSYVSLFIKLLKSDSDIIHFHTINYKVRSILWIFKFITNKKIILTVHGQSYLDQMKKSNFIIKKMLVYTLQKIDNTIFVDEKNVKFLRDSGYDMNRIVYIPSFIFPYKNNKEEVYPNIVNEFMNSPKLKIVINGSIAFYDDNEVYGFYKTLKILKCLLDEGVNNKEIILLIAILDSKNLNSKQKEYYDKLKRFIVENNMKENVVIYEVENTELYPIVNNSDLFIRPTIVDGFGVSIAEALFVGTPALATNVCKRPKGTILFNVNNNSEFYEKMKDLICNNDVYKTKLKDINVKDSSDEIIRLYEGK
ncbi:glycosyltransferase family 4 protein [Clostridium carnis]